MVMGLETVAEACGPPRTASEPQSSLSRSLGQGLDAAVVAVAAAIEHTGLDLRTGRALRDQLARLFGLLHRSQAIQVALGPVDGGQRAAGVVVDELGGDAAVRAEYRQTRALPAAAGLRAHAAATAQALPGLGQDRHV